MIRHVNKKHQVTLPPQFLEALGVEGENYLSVELNGRRIILKPVRIEEDEFSEDELEELQKLIDKQIRRKEYVSFGSNEEALAHLKKLTKKK